MGKLSGIFIAKGVEFQLIILLHHVYGKAKSLAELLEIYGRQDELARIGTITCLVLVASIIVVTSRSIAVHALNAISRARAGKNERQAASLPQVTTATLHPEA